ncbi:tetratricopeptide repeat protein [Actinokineospora globicatena]|uniref:tetratricopeptide repeat protein n=1 Tax=Actinokineospora globicatena TaxID=103729 RepID=UPI0020A5DDE2|nr:tetratricopeptide repeat protein [Actinokineospora globicatena]MCP2302825.1 Tetratricopeptide (TPR) repeat [Actinokineospora globicatena]GLW78792.1 hypothetical protein Aglo01_32740 [Actinokineospora globicatena]GLW84540.1 hypothetical protein Aglo02_21800 [Actinokineospora globicatena]
MAERVPTLQELIRRRQSGGFVGRREQLAEFEANLALPLDDPRRRFLFTLHGSAGVGKTFLMRQFTRIAREAKVLTASVDESVFDVLTAIEAIVADLDQQGARCRDFPKLLADYRTRRHELETDPGTPEEISSALTRTVVRVGLRAASDIPFVGAVAEEVDGDAVAGRVDRMRTFLGRKFRNHDDMRLILSPVEVLTAAFLRDLDAIAASRPVALFFDTYERTGAFLDPWLLDVLAGHHGSLPGTLLLTIAGQSPLDANRWGEFLPVRADYPLEVFTEEEARQLLADRGVTKPAVVNTILELSGRLPVWVATLASTHPDEADAVGDPSGSAVERFLKWEPDPDRRTAALHGALPRRLDHDVFAAACAPTPAEDHFTWLGRLPFVVEHATGYRYHDVVRSAMLRVLRRKSTLDWQHRHQALATHYASAKEGLGLSGRDAWKSEAWQDLALEEHYHRLCAQGQAALPAALGGLIDAIAWRSSAVGYWLRMIRQAGTDSANPAVISRAKALPAVSKTGENTLELLTDLINDRTVRDQDRATALGERGALQDANHQESALADFNAAINIRTDQYWTIAWRGDAYRLLGRYDEAIVDLDRAIEMNPEYSWALASKGWANWQLKNRDKALIDLGRAIEIDSGYGWAIGVRGQIYTELVRYEDALAEFDRIVQLSAGSRASIARRAELLLLMGRYDDAIADCERCISLEPDRAQGYLARGSIYSDIGRNEDALRDFDRALELSPESSWGLSLRADSLRIAGRFNEALLGFDRAIEIDSNSSFSLGGRGEVLRILGRYDDAVADFDGATEIDDLNEGWYHYQSALALIGAGRVEVARERLSRAVATEEVNARVAPQDLRIAFNIAVYRLALGESEEAHRIVRDAMGKSPTTVQVRVAIRDFRELHEVLGCDVEGILALLDGMP